MTKGRRDPGGGVQGDKGTWGALGCQRDMRGWGCQRDPGGSGCQRDVGGVGVPKGPGGFGVPCALKAPCSCRKTWVGARPCSSPRYPPNPPPSCSSAGSASLFHTVTTICDSTDVTPGRVCPPPPTKPRGLCGALGVGGGGISDPPTAPKVLFRLLRTPRRHRPECPQRVPMALQIPGTPAPPPQSPHHPQGPHDVPTLSPKCPRGPHVSPFRPQGPHTSLWSPHCPQNPRDPPTSPQGPWALRAPPKVPMLSPDVPKVPTPPPGSPRCPHTSLSSLRSPQRPQSP